jgi:F-type H+-transporting ATPase subunit delta
MNSFRVARAALRVRSAAIKTPIQRRGYAEAVSDKVGCSRVGFFTDIRSQLLDQVELGSSSSGMFVGGLEGELGL